MENRTSQPTPPADASVQHLRNEIAEQGKEILRLQSELTTLKHELRPAKPVGESIVKCPATYLKEGETNVEARIRLYTLLNGMLDCSVLQNDLGVLCHEMGETNKALQHFKTAIAIDRTNMPAQKNCADLLARLGEHHDAIDIYEEILNQKADDLECLIALASVRALTQQYESAEYCVRRALQLAPTDKDARQLLSHILSSAKPSGAKAPEKESDVATTRLSEEDYQSQLRSEINTYRENTRVHDLPPINHEFNNSVLAPLLGEMTGETDFLTWWANEMKSLTNSLNRPVRALSIGCGNGDVEIDIVKRSGNPQNLHMLGVDINPHMVQRANALARQDGLSTVEFEVGDFNALQLRGLFDVVIANHSLHHVVELEKLLSAIDTHATNEMIFLVNDMIGRNGHVMWKNTEKVVRDLWDSLDEKYKLNWHTRVYDREPMNHDFSHEGFEGIRAQDILPLLNETFDIDVFLPFYSIINRFVDRVYGHNFSMNDGEDVSLAKELTALDVKLLREKKLPPVQAFMRLRKKGQGRTLVYRFQTPEEALASRSFEIRESDYLSKYLYAEEGATNADREQLFAEVFG